MKIIQVFPVIQDPKAEVLLFHCIDPRFEEAWRGLPRAIGLEPGEYASIKLAGGPAPLAYPKECPSRSKYAAQQLLFARDKFKNLKQCFFIGHEGCKYYCTIPEPRSETEDLALAGSLAKSLFPEWEIGLQFASFTNNGMGIKFEEIAASERIIEPPARWGKYHKLAHSS